MPNGRSSDPLRQQSHKMAWRVRREAHRYGRGSDDRHQIHCQNLRQSHTYFQGFQGNRYMVKLYYRYKTGQISWEDFKVVVNYMLHGAKGRISANVSDLEINVIDGEDSHNVK